MILRVRGGSTGLKHFLKNVTFVGPTPFRIFLETPSHSGVLIWRVCGKINTLRFSCTRIYFIVYNKSVKQRGFAVILDRVVLRLAGNRGCLILVAIFRPGGKVFIFPAVDHI